MYTFMCVIKSIILSSYCEKIDRDEHWTIDYVYTLYTQMIIYRDIEKNTLMRIIITINRQC